MVYIDYRYSRGLPVVFLKQKMSSKSYTCSNERCSCCSIYDDRQPISVEYHYIKQKSNHAEQKRQRDYIDFFSDFKPAGETSCAGPSKLRPSYPTYRQGDITRKNNLYIEVKSVDRV